MPVSPEGVVYPKPGIVVVENDPGLRDVLYETLQDEVGGLEVYAFVDSQIAWTTTKELHTQGQYLGGAIVDYNLPGLMGTSYLDQMRRLYPHALTMLTTGQEVSRIPKNDLRNVDIFLPKPFNIIQIISFAERVRDRGVTVLNPGQLSDQNSPLNFRSA
jgi:DNA-binding response OmpR family regulator